MEQEVFKWNKKQTGLRLGSDAGSITSLVSSFALANQEAQSQSYWSFLIDSIKVIYCHCNSPLPFTWPLYFNLFSITTSFLLEISLFHCTYSNNPLEILYETRQVINK